MPGAVAVRPNDGKVFVASMKTGELFTLEHPDDPKKAKFANYGNGLFQDALSMLAEDDGLYVLHRRNLTKITESSGVADKFERVAALPQGIADAYDMGYGLARDKDGRFVFGHAAYGDPEDARGRFRAATETREASRGSRVRTAERTRLVQWQRRRSVLHRQSGRLGRHEQALPRQRGEVLRLAQSRATAAHHEACRQDDRVGACGWARSINGVTYDNTGGKFGPFAGQFFMAELMFGGAIIRANVEKVNGVYQGACFPFWGKGLLGPVTLAFDPRGKLYVGGITEPGWMARTPIAERCSASTSPAKCRSRCSRCMCCRRASASCLHDP
ncbi:MAG: hypothetical protein U0792_05890 [Gemmataceae bacterium]